MNIPQEKLLIREGVLEYAQGKESEDLRKDKLENLLGFLSKKLGKDVSMEDVAGSSYDISQGISSWLDMEREDMVRISYNIISFEEEALSRLEKILGQPLYDVDLDELREHSKNIFMMPGPEYQELVDKNNLKYKHPMDLHRDMRMVFGVLKARGEEITVDEMKDVIKKTELGMGYFDNMFRGSFEFGTSKENYYRPQDIMHLYTTFHSDLSEQKDNLEKHLAYDKKLREQHKVAAPVLLTDNTMNLDVIPYSVGFLSTGELVLLCGREDRDESDPESAKMMIEIYDVNEGTLVDSQTTKLYSSFDGALGMAFNFQGNLTVGSDDNIYLNGGSQIFTKHLEDITKEYDEFEAAKLFVDDEELFGWDKQIFQVVEDNGIFYFALQPSWFPKCYNNIIVAADGEKIIGEPLCGYSPSAGHGGSNWDDTARLVVNGNELFFKANHSIFAVDRSLTSAAWKTAFPIVHEDDLAYGCIPSNHCLSPKGVLYAATQLKKEEKGDDVIREIAESVKGYRRGKEKGEFVTHFYPEGYPGGFSSLRSMAISKQGLLAYTNIDENKIHLYKLQED